MNQFNTHVGAYALDDLLAAASNDIIKNGFNNSTFPPIIKGWFADKILSVLPERFLSDIVKLIVEERDLNECLTYIQDDTQKEIKIRFIQNEDYSENLYDKNVSILDETEEENIFRKNETSCHFFDTQIIPEVPFQEQVAKTEKFVKYEQIEARGSINLEKSNIKRKRKHEISPLKKTIYDDENDSDPDFTEKPKNILPKNLDPSNQADFGIKYMKPTLRYPSSESSDSDGMVRCKHCDAVSYSRENDSRHQIKKKLHRHIRRQHPKQWEEKLKRSKSKPNVRSSSRYIDPENNKSYYLNKFACDFCDGFFSSRSGLTHHLKKWHPEKLVNGIQYKFKCAPCEFLWEFFSVLF